MAKVKICSHCGSSFECKSLKKKWCSVGCKNIQYRIKYPERVATQQLNWQRSNKDKILQHRSIPTNKIAANLRSRLSKALGRNQKTVSMSEYLGCSLQELRTHLESQFKPGMSWDNYALEGWHVDHIRPLNLFDLSDPDQIKVACHFSNLQPLWAKDNRSKGDSYEER